MTLMTQEPKRTLNNIMQDFHALDDMLAETEGVITPEMEDLMFWLQGELEDKLDGYQSFIDYMKGQMAYLREAENELARRRKIIENSVNRFKSRMIMALNNAGITKLKTTRHSYSIRLTESVAVDEAMMMNNISESEYRQLEKDGLVTENMQRKFDKRAIKEHYNGSYPKWVLPTLRESLTVR